MVAVSHRLEVTIWVTISLKISRYSTDSIQLAYSLNENVLFLPEKV
ncbi:hypothetical protein KA405_06320 [Patescibacteria group bacterium]|nr:hypothetical protein [Patescibacteria group bacterium]